MTARIRTGYSFRQAAGKIDEVIAKLLSCGWANAPITDTSSTFGFVPWRAACRKANFKPVYGVELAVSPSPAAQKPTFDLCTFLAIDDLTVVNGLVGTATNQFRYQPLLSLDQFNKVSGVVKIIGRRMSPLSDVIRDDNTYVALSPSVNPGYIREAMRLGFRPIACSDNKYVNESDFSFYETLVGRTAGVQTYPQHILTDDEWLTWMVDELELSSATCEAALRLRDTVLGGCNAQLAQGSLLVPDKPVSLRDLCIEGADRLGIELGETVAGATETYGQRLDRELTLIEEKDFEDYFFIVSDMVAWARERMTVGPGRGSCCGSLVCYLTSITTVDPLVQDLLLERFISVDRNDLPDIDVDFPPTKRDLVFSYLDQKYGAERVGRLGSVGLFKADSALNETCGALKIPLGDSIPVKESVEKYVMNDARGLVALADALRETQQGKAFLRKYPEAIIATRLEGHPRHNSTHAAGILLSDKPLINYTSTDMRIGTTQLDKGMAEELGLLKIDVLGVKQLDVFESALRMVNLPHTYLDKITLDDAKVFDVLNNRKYTGIFQFNGSALQRIASGIRFNTFDEIVAATALARPGPMQGGATEQWIKRKAGKMPVDYWHPCFEPYLNKTLGVIVYQEQILAICKTIGEMEWSEVTAVRQGMAKSKGSEYLRPYGEKFKAGCVRQGLESHFADKLWNDIVGFGSYAFNKCLDGETLIYRYSGNQYTPQVQTIKELYNDWVGSPNSYRKNKLLKGQGPDLISFDGEKAVKNFVKNIYKTGNKVCWRFEFDDGTFVICTKEHKFIVNGQWQQIGLAKIGDRVASIYETEQNIPVTNADNGKSARGKNYGLQGKGFPYGEDNPSWKNGFSKYVKDFKLANKHNPCAKCKQVSKRMEAHHQDFNGGRDRPKDLIWLCASCHKKEHYNFGDRTKKGNLVKRKVTFKTLTNVKYEGVRETYDIEMNDPHHNFMLANGLITHNSHSVAYAIISYHCCWLKAYYPLEFMAATLNYEKDAEKQILLLKELALEGISYVPVDPVKSTDVWSVVKEGGTNKLVGPISGVIGLGPKMQRAVVEARARGEAIPDRAAKLLSEAKTNIDSLTPISDRIKFLMPDPGVKNIYSLPVSIESIVNGERDRLGDLMIFCCIIKVTKKNENSKEAIERRHGTIVDGPAESLMLVVKDDTGQTYAKIGKEDFSTIGAQLMDQVKTGKSLYAIKGKIWRREDFRMILVRMIRYIGEM